MATIPPISKRWNPEHLSLASDRIRRPSDAFAYHFIVVGTEQGDFLGRPAPVFRRPSRPRLETNSLGSFRFPE
jgi:hypothetical protein